MSLLPRASLTLLSIIIPLLHLSLLISHAEVTQASNSQFLQQLRISLAHMVCRFLVGCRLAMPLLRSVVLVHRLVRMTEEKNKSLS